MRVCVSEWECVRVRIVCNQFNGGREEVGVLGGKLLGKWQIRLSQRENVRQSYQVRVFKELHCNLETVAMAMLCLFVVVVVDQVRALDAALLAGRAELVGERKRPAAGGADDAQRKGRHHGLHALPTGSAEILV